MSGNDTPPGSGEFVSATPVVYFMPPAEESRKIDLIDYLHAVWERKIFICAVTLVFIVLGVIWALISPPVYRVDVVLTPTQSGRTSALAGRLGGLASLAGLDLNAGNEATQAVAILSSRAYAESFIADNNLLPVLFAEEWDAQAKTWKDPDPAKQPNLWNAVTFFHKNVLTVDQDAVTGLVRMSVEWTDPNLAADWARQLVDRINVQLQTRALQYGESKLQYLNTELQRTNQVEVRAAIAYVIQEQVQSIALAKGETEYAFRIIDPPRVPMEKVRPKRTLIAVLSAMVGGLFSLAIVTLLYLTKVYRSKPT